MNSRSSMGLRGFWLRSCVTSSRKKSSFPRTLPPTRTPDSCCTARTSIPAPPTPRSPRPRPSSASPRLDSEPWPAGAKRPLEIPAYPVPDRLPGRARLPPAPRGLRLARSRRGGGRTHAPAPSGRPPGLLPPSPKPRPTAPEPPCVPVPPTDPGTRGGGGSEAGRTPTAPGRAEPPPTGRGAPPARLPGQTRGGEQVEGSPWTFPDRVLGTRFRSGGPRTAAPHRYWLCARIPVRPPVSALPGRP
jgi:hypothetical protein